MATPSMRPSKKFPLPWASAPMLRSTPAMAGRLTLTAVSAGMNINSIFEILSDKILGNRYLEQQLTIAFEDIQRGESISEIQ